MNNDKIVVLDGARTPIGSFGGALEGRARLTSSVPPLPARPCRAPAWPAPTSRRW